jgi:thiol-disulfide isomerase/thioredoxin
MIMVARAVLGGALLAAIPAMPRAWSHLRLWGARHDAARDARTPMRLRHGLPAVLYFHSSTCTTCRTVQKPALEQLRDRWRGPLQVVEIDALTHPALADRWSVITVPTTVVLNPLGLPHRVHHGPASTEMLEASLRGATMRVRRTS